MATNLQTFIERSRRYLRELNPDTSFWTSTFMQQLFNASYRLRCSQLVMAYEGYFQLVATRNIETDKEAYGFPDELQRLIKIEIVRSDGVRIPLQRAERHEHANRANNSTGAGDNYMPNFRPHSHGFVLEPPPIDDITNGLRLEYVGLPAFLSSDADQVHPSWPGLYDELLVLDTVCLAIDAEGIHELGPVPSIKTARSEWEARFERFIENRIVARQRVEPFVPFYSDY